MIRHILMMIRHQARKYFAVAVEMVLVFTILLWSVTALFNAIEKYKSPGMLDTEGVVILGVVRTDAYYKGRAKDWGFTDNVMARIKNKDYITSFVESLNFTPYLRPETSLAGSVYLPTGEKIHADFRAVDGDVESVFKPELIGGRWFVDGEITNQKYRTAVVTADFAKKAKMENPIGQTFRLHNEIYQIVGILSGYKNRPMDESSPSIVFPLNGFYYQQRCSAWREFGIKVKPGYEEQLIDDFYKEFKQERSSSNAKDAIALVYDSSALKSRMMKDAVTEISFVGIPAVFLFLFTLLGMVGVNLMDVKSRMREFALRISVGATVKKIAIMIFLQNLVVGLISIIPGVIIISVVNDFAMTSLYAIGVILILVLLLSITVVIYPSVLIARMSPAILLKEG